MEARVGIEPTHKGFADLSLTTWVPRLEVCQVRRRALNSEQGILRGMGAYLVVRRVYGAGDRGRTGDIFLGKEALYH